MGYVQDLISKGYGGYQGWNDAAAQADFNATKGAGKQTSSSSSFSSPTTSGAPDYASIARQQMQLQQEANAPAIQSLQNSISTTGQNYDTQIQNTQAQKDPLSARYDSLLNSLVGQQSTATSREFGRRGVPLSSGLFDQSLLEQTQPIRQSVGADKNMALQGLDSQVNTLTSNKTSALQGIQDAIAKLQSGGASDGIKQALGLYQNQLQSQQQAQALAAQQAQQANENAYRDTAFNYKKSQDAIADTPVKLDPFYPPANSGQQTQASPNNKLSLDTFVTGANNGGLSVSNPTPTSSLSDLNPFKNGFGISGLLQNLFGGK